MQHLNETDYKNRARAHGGLASVYSRYGEPWNAIEVSKDALLNYRLAADFENEALCLTAIGNMYTNQGDQFEAMNAYREALECYRESGDTQAQLAVLKRIIELRDSDDPVQEAAMLLELGEAYTDAGEYSQALEALAEAMRIQINLNDTFGQAQILLQSGVIHRIRQEYTLALTDMTQALALAIDNDGSRGEADIAMLRGKIWVNLGETYFRQSLYDEALSQYQRALEQYETAGDLDGQGQTLMKIGETYLAQGDYVASVEYYDRALEILKQTDEHIYQVLAYMQNMVDDNHRGLYWDAVEAYLRALGIIHEAGMFMYAEELHRYQTDILLPPVVTPTPTPTFFPTLTPSVTSSPGPTITIPSSIEAKPETIQTNPQLAPATPVLVATSTNSSPTSADSPVAATTSAAHPQEATQTPAPTPAPTDIKNPPPSDVSNPVATNRDASSSSNGGSIRDDDDSIEAPVNESGEPSDNEQTWDEPFNDNDTRSDLEMNTQPGTLAPTAADSTAMTTSSGVSMPAAPNASPYQYKGSTQAPTEAVSGWATECRRASEGLPPTDDPRFLKSRADKLKRCAEHYLRDKDYAESLEMTLPEIDIRKRLEDREGAIQALIRKLLLFQKTDRSKIEQADVMRAIADLLILQGRDKEALTYLNDILTIFQQNDLFAQAAQTQNSIGLIWLRQGDFLQAERAFLDAQAILKKHPNPAIMALTNGNLGALRYLLGQYGQALIFFQKALDSIDLLESERVLNVLVMMGKTAYHFRLGHLAPARQNFEHVLAEYKKTEYLSIKATLLNHLALVHYQQIRTPHEKYKAAAPLYRRAMANFRWARTMMRVLGEPASAWTIANNMGLLNCRMGRMAAQSGLGKKATAYYTQALAAFQEVHAQAIGGEAGQSATLHNLGRVHAALGQYDEALNRFEQALEKGQDADKARTLGEMGYVYEHKGNLDKAVEYYVRSINIQDRIRREARIDAFKISLADQSTDVFQRTIPLLIGMGRIEEAFNLSEQARARALLEQLGARPERLLANTSSKLLAEKLALKNKLRQLRQQLQKEQADHAKRGKTRPNHAIAQLEKQIDAQLIKYDQMTHAMEIHQTEAQAFTRAKPLTMSEVKQHLDDDATLVSYFVTPEKLIAFILTRNASHAVEIPVREDELAQTINWTPQASADYPTLPSLKKLYQWLVQPVQPYLKTQTVRVAPHGILHHAPFHALTADGTVYWGDQYKLSRLPNASLLPFLRQERSLSGRNRALAFGNPFGSMHGLPDLECVKDETRFFAQNFGATPYIGKAATESRLVANAEDADIIFVSSHARLDTAHPLHSHLVLSPDDSHDGLLEVGEIYKLYLKNAPLVVLSACNTYLGKHSRGDEIVGLTRAFFHAGASSVVSSLWKVNDDATSYFMQNFGGFLARGLDQAAALTQARRVTRQRYPKPLYWAAFVLTGDPGKGDKMVAAR